MHYLSFILVFGVASLFAAEAAPAVKAEEKITIEQEQIAKLSEAFGHLIGKNIETIGIQFDMASIVKGLEDAAQGKNSPMTEAECVQAISHAQEEVFKEQAIGNLKKADEFMVKNASEPGIVTIEKGKLQYKIDKEGSGALVEEHFSPMIRYTGKYLDGTVFGSSKEDEMISLDETIPGFSKGLLGMKEGEKRILYIHPDLGYGTNGYLPPNSLLTFEIEIVKANIPEQQEMASTGVAKDKSSSEIATPATSTKGDIR